MRAAIHVVAAALFDGDGRVLIAQRRSGTHMAGCWEFPGGKLNAGEDPRTGLDREILEELGIRVCEATPLIRYRHRYPQRDVLLDIWLVSQYAGVALGLEGQAIRWVDLSELAAVDLLEADKPIIDALRLPRHYANAPVFIGDRRLFSRSLRQLLDAGTELLLINLANHSTDAGRDYAQAAVELQHGAKILLGGDPAQTAPLAMEIGAAGIHVSARYLTQQRPAILSTDMIVGASCHTAEQLLSAVDYGANFAVLGPVEATESQPQAAVLGWRRFAELLDDAKLPVYASGGVGTAQTHRAVAAGAQGIAEISAVFES